MLRSVQLLWEKLSELGAEKGMSNSDKVRLMLLNKGLAIAFLIQLIFIVKQFFFERDWSFSPPMLVSLVIIITLFFSARGYSQYIRIFVNIFFPWFMMLLMYLYGPALQAEYAFFVLFVIAIIFNKEPWLQFFFLLYNLSMYLLGLYVSHHFGNPLAARIELLDQAMIFISCAICIVLVIRIYYLENLKYERRTEALLKTLEEKNNYLKNAYKELENFNYVTSHDLKSPLRTIHSYTNLLERELKGYDKKVESHLSFIRQGIKKMDKILEGILDFSTIDQYDTSNKDLIQPLDLETLIRKEVDRVSQLQSKSAELHFDSLPIMYVHTFYWETMVQKLIENSIIYNESPIVRIDVSCDISETGWFTLHIKDNGIGIHPDFHEKIFEMFNRLHNEKYAEGAGMGLAVCKKIAERMGGSILVRSETGVGAQFSISVPRNAKGVYKLEMKENMQQSSFS
jgi:signal transduction histidine kinase